MFSVNKALCSSYLRKNMHESRPIDEDLKEETGSFHVSEFHTVTDLSRVTYVKVH